MSRWAPVFLFVVAASPAMAREAQFQDAFGYQRFSAGADECGFHWVDASADSAELMLSDTDDGVASLTLQQSISIYGAAQAAVSVSSNGYLAFGDDDGEDFSNDCPIPAVPGNDESDGARIMALHDDLSAGQTGRLDHAFYNDCPRASGSSIDGACTVFTWNNWQVTDTDAGSFQVVLYHDSGAIAVQHLDLAGTAGASATVGLQNTVASSGTTAGCDSSEAIQFESAMCLYNPAFPAVTIPFIFRDGFEEL